MQVQSKEFEWDKIILVKIYAQKQKLLNGKIESYIPEGPIPSKYLQWGFHA